MKNSGKAVEIGRQPCGQTEAADRIRRNAVWIKSRCRADRRPPGLF